LTAYDLARTKGHAECVDVLLQHGGKSGVDCKVSKLRHEAQQVVQQAHDAAAREAQYWISDELELQRRAAVLVATTVNNATASLTAAHSCDSNTDDQDKIQRSTEVYQVNSVDYPNACHTSAVVFVHNPLCDHVNHEFLQK